MIDLLLLGTFLAINFLIFSNFEKRISRAGFMDSVIIGLTTALSGSYMAYVLIRGLGGEMLVVLPPLIAVEMLFLIPLTLEQLRDEMRPRVL